MGVFFKIVFSLNLSNLLVLKRVYISWGHVYINQNEKQPSIYLFTK